MSMMCMLIDLNTTEDETTSLSNSPSSSASASGISESVKADGSALYMELWRACAGPLISLPKKGSAVVYFPQRHVEQLPENPAAHYDLPPHVFCRVVDVKLRADSVNDEVYALVSLIPDQQIGQGWTDGTMEGEDDGKSMTSHMFCKTLTASDISTHGGFSVPRRAAEDCFPPLDYKQQRPSQELVAKDLHGTEWKFRHIYRGQPRRHLLTTGWSAFVNKKKLTSGDAVLFLRGSDGELRLGIRRASQAKIGATVLAPSRQQFAASSIAAVVNSISKRSTFRICYNPRARSSEIMAPYHKFSKSVSCSFSPGMRFKIRFETEDSSPKSGIIVGVSDVDPVRWPGSKWKCLLVRWDEMDANRLFRVSPWEIEPSGSVSGPSSFLLAGTKRSRDSFPGTKTDFQLPARDGKEVSDFKEPLRINKVLQGQEIFGFPVPYATFQAPIGSVGADGSLNKSLHFSTENSSDSAAVWNESIRFPKVLQGQQTVTTSLHQKNRSEATRAHEHRASNDILHGFQVPTHGHCLSTPAVTYDSPSLVPGSSPSSVLMLQQSHPSPPQFMSFFNQRKLETCNRSSTYSCPRILSCQSASSESLWSAYSEDQNPINFLQPPPLQAQPLHPNNQKFASMCKKSCRLFGFHLTEGYVAASKEDNPASAASTYVHESGFIA